MDSKQPIQLLHEIELKITTLTNEIDYIQRAESMGEERAANGKWIDMLYRQEKDRKTARQEAIKLINDQEERAKKEKVQANLNKRMHANRKKVGKQDMLRSNKPKVKTKTVKRVID